MSDSKLTPEQWRQIRQLFEDVRCKPSELRGPFLDRACEGDDAVRRGVEELLEHDYEDEFLEEPALGDHFHASSGEEFVNIPANSGLTPIDAIPGFDPIRVIGRGADGVVYEATQHRPQRRVAIKVLADAFADPVKRTRFIAESQTLAELDHPAVARVLAAGELADGRPWIAMELIRGEPLTRWIELHQPSLLDRVSLLAEIADGANAAHAMGIVHRDLKPANILITADGHPKILDFGIARGTDLSNATIAGTIMGTVPWMSPEQVAGSGDVDARSDVYALGVLLHQAINESMPYELPQDNLPAAARIICEQLPKPSGGPRDLRAIIGRALEKSPDRRYSSGGDLGADLRRLLEHHPVQARPATLAYRLQQRVRRAPAVWALVAIVAMTGLVFGIILAAQQSHTRSVVASAAVETTAKDRAQYRAGLQQATDALDRGDSQAAAAALQECPKSLRHWEWGWLQSRVHRDATLPKSLPSGDAAINDEGLVTALNEHTRGLPPKWTHAAMSDSGAVITLNVDGELSRLGNPEPLLTGLDPATIAAIRLDRRGTRLALAISPRINPVDPTTLTASTRVLLLDANTGEPLLDDLVGDRMLDSPAALAVSDGGRIVVACDLLGGLTIWKMDPPSRRRIHVSQGPATISLSQDGRTLAIGAAAAGMANAWAISSDTLSTLEGTPVIAHDRGIVAVALTANGNTLASLDASGLLRVTSLDNQAGSWSIKAHPSQVARGVRFSPSGQWLLTRGADGSLKRWPRHGTASHVASWPDPIRRARIDPDGTALVETQDAILRRRIPSGDATPATMDPDDDFKEACRMSNGGGRTASGDDAGGITVVKTNGERLWSQIAHASPVQSVSLSSDGRRVLSVAIAGDVVLHDAKTGDQLAVLPWPGYLVIAAGFVNDDQTVAMLSMDGKLRLLSGSVLSPASQQGRPESQ
jgi:WD40 repeat protein/tRNA A-37 threonylcarbamoyl transferase component Bud32